MKKAILIYRGDNVATMIEDVCTSENVELSDREGKTLSFLQAVESIDMGHKIALRDFSIGDTVLKYGFPIGRVAADIKMGERVDVHNIESRKGRGDLRYQAFETGMEKQK